MSSQAEQHHEVPPRVDSRRPIETGRASVWNDDLLLLTDAKTQIPALADVLRWQGSRLRDSGFTAQAEPLYQRSLRMANDLAYQSGQAHAINCLGTVAQQRGELDRAERLFADATSMATRCGDARLLAMIETNRGIVADIRGKSASALAHYLESLRVFESLDDPRGVTQALNNLGLTYAKMGRAREAESAYRRAMSIAHDRGDTLSAAVLHENRAELLLQQGDLTGAVESITIALQIADQRNDGPRRAAALKLRGMLERQSGNPRVALQTFRDAMTWNAAGEDTLMGAELLFEYGLALSDAGDGILASAVWNEALRVFERIGASDWMRRVRERMNPEERASTM